MLTADQAFVVADRLNLFVEIETIACELSLLERLGGPIADVADLRQRIDHARLMVLGQLRAVLGDSTPLTIH